MAAKAETMSIMHEALAKNYLEILTKGVEEKDRDGNIRWRKANAAELNAVNNFLKNNGISADPEHNGVLKELKEELPFANNDITGLIN